MTKKLAILLTVIVTLPFMIVGALVFRIAKDDQELLLQQQLRLQLEELSTLAQTIHDTILNHDKKLQTLCESQDLSIPHLRELAAGHRLVRQMFIIGTDGKLQFPAHKDDTSAQEEAFLDRSRHIWLQRHPFKSIKEQPGQDDHRGFYTWYHNRGLHIIYWATHKTGVVVGLEVEKAAFISDIVGNLPDTVATDAANRQIRLVRTGGDPVYILGKYYPTSKALPTVTKELAVPLASWRLHYFAPPLLQTRLFGQKTLFTLGIAGILLTAVLISVFYFIFEYSRQTRLAKQQVSFVNQVSHELKTPLTNIRMYAELLMHRLDDEDEKLVRYANNISIESSRLGRLIQNVLSFARSNRGKLTLRIRKAIVDDTVLQVLEQFSPALSRLGFKVETDLNASAIIQFDADVVEQIVTNLCSNVEKYAKDGKWIRIETYIKEQTVQIVVRDAGLGIENSAKDKIFAPFTQITNHITKGATGTGIGLTISKELAHLHGGTLKLLPTQTGAAFELCIPITKDDP